ncbi:MAG: response regulator transcription factor [Lachnospiraceae bacterium]|nr:response regulator transcription factor [Lachnospiraceae bacterium]MDE6980774.1 response regulator transcription factor [Lachnospiraceae bacterium]
MQSILILEDDENLNRGISLKLGREGYQVFSASSVFEGKKIFLKEKVEMVISDINLPDGSGLDFGAWVRENSACYLLYLTARDTEIDMINGYDTGADDYMTKPFSLAVLISKVNALMRRLEGLEYDVLCSGDIEFHKKEMQVKKKGEMLSLSRTEMLLLLYFLENPGQILTKEQILTKIWGNDGQFVEDNTVNVNISRLKSKIGTDCISNVRGLGYIWTEKTDKK